jgi:uncharacterized protein
MKMIMKNYAIIFKSVGTIASTMLLVFLFSSCQKEVFDAALTQQEFAIQANANGATYKIKVGLPADYNSSTKKYAAIYVLDGEENFEFVSNKCKEISDKLAVTNVLVISIGYGRDRSIDYTPAKTSTGTIGSLEFLNFIETQLIPKIEEAYRVDTARSSRVILGHSYGGLFVANAFSYNNKLFGNYIILSPSLWYDNLISLQFEKDNQSKNKNRAQLVFMGLGGAENLGRMQAPFEAFYQMLRDNYTAIKLAKNIEKNLDHMGSKHPNMVKGLNYYFENR